MSAEHTPGPWETQEPFRGRLGGASIWSDGMLVAMVAGEAGFDFANAHLISAAPDLLAACEAWIAMNNLNHTAMGQAIRAAVAKARGKGGE